MAAALFSRYRLRQIALNVSFSDNGAPLRPKTLAPETRPSLPKVFLAGVSLYDLTNGPRTSETRIYPLVPLVTRSGAVISWRLMARVSQDFFMSGISARTHGIQRNLRGFWRHFSMASFTRSTFSACA